MPEVTPQPKSNNPALPIIIIVVVLGAAFLVFRGFFGKNFAERRTEQLFEAQTGGKADVDFDEGSKFEFETEDGKVVIDQQGSLPSDFPNDIQIYGGAKVIAYISMDSEDVKGFNATISTEDSQEDVYAFYLTSLESDGWTIISQLTSGEYSSVGAEKGDRTLVVTITTDGDKTVSIITVKTE